MNLGLTISRSAQRYPEHVAVFADDRRVTYRELDRQTNRLAHALSAAGLERGDRILMFSSARTEVVELLGAAAKAGIVYVGLAEHVGQAELDSILANCQPRAIFFDDATREVVGAATAGDDEVRLVDLDAGGLGDLVAGASDHAPASLFEIGPRDDCCIIYTSGTTGLPKGVLFDHGAVVDHALVVAHEYEITEHSRYLMVIPHKSCLNIAIAPCLTMGAAMGFSRHSGFEARSFAREVGEIGVTHCFLVPTMLFRLLESLPESETSLLDTMVTFGYGSAPTPPERIQQLVERFGSRFHQLYGMTETASIASALRKADHVSADESMARPTDSVGQPSWRMAIRIIGADGRDAAPGERGEIAFRSSYIMKEYYGDPVRTAEALIDGWLYSGDIGLIDERGFLHVVDRKKNMIIRGGLNIVPTEVEGVLYRHPAVTEVSVVGIPDDEWGEIVAAAVQVKVDADVSPDDLVSWCRESDLPRPSVPARVLIVDELPKNSLSKTDKSRLREMIVDSTAVS